VDCVRCGSRSHAFFVDPVGDLLSYLCKPGPWCEKVIAITHNAKGFDAHFIFDKAILLKWTPKLILNGQKIVCMTIHHLTFYFSISYLPMALRKLPEAFGLTASKSWYPHYFNTQANLNYVGAIPGIEHYVVDQMNESERNNSWHSTIHRKTRSSITDTFCKNIVRMTSPFYVRRVRYFLAISSRSETLMYF